MLRKPAPVTETELAIMEVLWNRAPVTVREIVESLYNQHTPALHSTVKSLLDRLAGKGFIDGDTSGFMHRFSPRISRQTYVAQELERLADSHFGGAFAPLLMSLADNTKLSRKERDTIRKIIASIPENK
jgi:BlaI family penicillinase repressor